MSWWSLPEMIGAAAVIYERMGGSVASLELWRRAHEGFLR
jgi:hypothetical protein